VGHEGNVEAVYCEFKYSGVGDGLLAGAAIATLAVLAATPVAIGLKASLALYVLALACRARRATRRVRAIRIDGERAIRVLGRNGECRTGAVRDGCFVAPWLTIVRWRPQGAWFDRTVLILQDMTGVDELRRLRVLIRWL
jgi:hypothetical protein